MAAKGILIGEVVRQTGLTERTLRYYEQEGLIAPGRSPAGQRLYGREDLEKVARIRLLKRAGFDLASIRRFLGGTTPTADLVGVQIAVLEDEHRRVEAALAAIRPIKARLDAGEAITVETLCALIEAAECAADGAAMAGVYDRYFTTDQQNEWRALTARAYADVDKRSHTHSWNALASAIKAALPLDPASQRGQSLLDEFETLLRPLAAVASPAQQEAASRFWRKVGEWGDAIDIAWNQDCSDFIRDAKAARAQRTTSKGDAA